MKGSRESPADCAGAFTAGSVGATLISLAWPILCSGVAEILDASVNVMWVSRELGDISLAALSNANLLWGLLFVSAFGISMAGAVRIGRSLGQGDIRRAKEAVGTMVSASSAASLICVVPMMIWTRSLVGCLGTPAAAQTQALEYLRILLLSVPLTYVNAAVIAALQAAGDSKTGFYLALASVAFDGALNPLFIVGIPPFPALGIAGSALATFASQAICFVVLLMRVYGTGHPLSLRGRDFEFLRIDLIRTGAMVRDGSPMALQVLWSSIEQMAMISLVNRLGADVTAAYGVLVQVWNLISMPAVAIGVAITAVVAQNIGAGRGDRVREAARRGLAYSVLVTLALVTIAEMFDRYLCGVFLPSDSPALAVAMDINREGTWSLIPLAGYTVWIGVLRATGAVWVPLTISVGVLAVRFPLTSALMGRWQAEALWWSFPASAAATSILAALHAYFEMYPRRAVSESG